MKIEEFNSTDYIFIKEQELSGCIISNEHYPTVRLYKKAEYGEWIESK